MVQTIYGLLAIMLLGLFTMNMTRGIFENEEKMILNEISTEVTSVGAEILDEIGKYAYDPSALPIGTLQVVNDPSVLQEEAEFGATSTCNPDVAFSGCFVINDFNGKTATKTRQREYQGNPYTYTYTVNPIVVRYVSTTAPHTPTGGAKSFAKEVVVTISCPEMYIGHPGNPLQVTMSRIYAYPDLQAHNVAP